MGKPLREDSKFSHRRSLPPLLDDSLILIGSGDELMIGNCGNSALNLYSLREFTFMIESKPKLNLLSGELVENLRKVIWK